MIGDGIILPVLGKDDEIETNTQELQKKDSAKSQGGWHLYCDNSNMGCLYLDGAVNFDHWVEKWLKNADLTKIEAKDCAKEGKGFTRKYYVPDTRSPPECCVEKQENMTAELNCCEELPEKVPDLNNSESIPPQVAVAPADKIVADHEKQKESSFLERQINVLMFIILLLASLLSGCLVCVLWVLRNLKERLNILHERLPETLGSWSVLNGHRQISEKLVFPVINTVYLILKCILFITSFTIKMCICPLPQWSRND